MSLPRSLGAGLAGPSRLSSFIGQTSSRALAAPSIPRAQELPCPRCFGTSSSAPAAEQQQQYSSQRRDGERGDRGSSEGRGGRPGSDRGQRGGRGGGRSGGGGGNSRGRVLPPFETWLKSKDAEQFRITPKGPGPHWLGETPFPMNPYFKPPPPIGSRLRNELWKLHKFDPATNTVRALSARFSIGLDRVLAILRLKALEEEMTAEGKPLQTPFQTNMDRILGAADPPNLERILAATGSKNAATAEDARSLLNAEPEPVPETTSASTRQAVLEDFPESGELESALKPALEEAGARSARSRKGLPTGAPDPNAQSENMKHNRAANRAIATASSSVGATTPRPRVRIVETGGKSYEGAHTLARNVRQANKRKGKRAEAPAKTPVKTQVNAPAKTQAKTQAKAKGL